MSLIRVVAALGLAVVGAYAQAPPAAARGGGAQAPVVVKTTQMGPHFWILGPFSTIGVFAGPDGILLVDAAGDRQHDAVIEAIRKISNAPIKYLVNTHVHADHTGGNEAMGKMGVTILARPEVSYRLEHPTPFNGQPGKPAPPAAMPMTTYNGTTTLRMNGEEVQLIPVLAAHTDGDTMVFFPQENVLMIGDFFRTQGYPNIGLADGGTLKGMLAGIDQAVALCGPDTKVVPGHGLPTDKNGLIAQRDMIVVLRDRVADQIKLGKTVDEAVAAHLTADYDSKVEGAVQGNLRTNDRFITQLYSELKGK